MEGSLGGMALGGFMGGGWQATLLNPVDVWTGRGGRAGDERKLARPWSTDGGGKRLAVEVAVEESHSAEVGVTDVLR